MTSTRTSLPLDNITITDELWSHYTGLVADVIIPYQWDILNDKVEDAPPSHCIENFRIAAGEQEGEHYGMVFQDSDLYKWLETVSYCIHNGTGSKYEAVADEIIDLIGRAQQPDGYLNTYYTLKQPGNRFTNLLEGHELYCAGHLIEAAVAYVKATGKKKLLEISMKFADLISEEFGTDHNQRQGYPGHQEIELALIKLYHLTGTKRYLKCAKHFIDVRGTEPNYFEGEIRKRGKNGIFHEFDRYDLKYSQSHMPPSQQTSMEGHAVRAMYMCSAMADLANHLEDTPLTNACDTLWDSVVNRRMYITGGIGSSGILERFTTDYDLPNDRNYSETCASIGLMMFGNRMALLKKNAYYYETVERALYNTVMAGISQEGDRYFYVNPLEVWPDNCIDRTSMEHVKAVRQRWFDVACCPTNVARTLASLGQYIYSMDEDGIYINLFISSNVRVDRNRAKVELCMNSQIMKDGKIVITINAEEGSFKLGIRLPFYAENYRIIVDGVLSSPETANGYLMLQNDWRGEHKIELEFAITARFVAANPKVRADAGKVALVKGPYVYCLEEVDNGDNLAMIYVEKDVSIIEHYDAGLPGALPMLSYEVKRMKYDHWDPKVLYQRAEVSMERAIAKAVPYGIWCNREPGEMIVWHKVLY